MVEETSSGFAAVLIALTMTVAPAVPSRFSAVPTSVWSARKLMLATPSSAEYATPNTIALSSTTSTSSAPDITPVSARIASAPPSAPMTMMPSSPRLMTPECSEKQPPSATRMRTEAKISVY